MSMLGAYPEKLSSVSENIRSGRSAPRLFTGKECQACSWCCFCPLSMLTNRYSKPLETLSVAQNGIFCPGGQSSAIRTTVHATRDNPGKRLIFSREHECDGAVT